MLDEGTVTDACTVGYCWRSQQLSGSVPAVFKTDKALCGPLLLPARTAMLEW